MMITAEAIYNAYPRHVGKIAAVKAIEKAMKTIEPHLLLRKVQGFAESVADKEAKFIPHPTTWFNQGRWDDEEYRPKPKAKREAHDDLVVLCRQYRQNDSISDEVAFERYLWANTRSLTHNVEGHQIPDVDGRRAKQAEDTRRRLIGMWWQRTSRPPNWLDALYRGIMLPP